MDYIKDKRENMIDIFDNSPILDPEGFGGEDYPSDVGALKEIMDNRLYPPVVSLEEEETIKKFYQEHPNLQTKVSESDSAWIQTFSGIKFHPLAPRSEDVRIEDIAHALSNICRFTGHCSSFYSVAQHSVLVSYICDSENALYGLLHDASEAYCQDIASPIKKTDEFKAYREVEARIQKTICYKFGLNIKEPLDVKRADQLLLATEARDLMTLKHPNWKLDISPLPFNIVALPPGNAKELFLNRFKELTHNE